MNSRNLKETLRSHVMDNALAMAGLAGRTRNKGHVTKARFKTPFVTLASKDGKSFRSGHWKNGHRHNPHAR